MITLDFDSVLAEVGVIKPDSTAVNRAIKRALRKTVRGAQRIALQAVSKQSGVAQKNIKKYHRLRIKIANLEANIWLGLNPLPLHLSGRVAWSKKSAGARVKGQTFSGAFYKDVYGGGKKVWIRSSRNQAEGHPAYHKKSGYRGFGGGVSRGRFPVELLGVPLEDASGEVETKVQNWALPFFKKRLTEELNFALNYE